MRVFTSRLIRQTLPEQDLNDLVQDFKAYKSDSGRPSTFGRDALYDHPSTYPPVRQEEIRHIHLTDPSYWPVYALQFNGTSDGICWSALGASSCERQDKGKGSH